LKNNPRDWTGPSLFGLLVFLITMFHSSTWVATLPEVVMIMLGVAGILLVRMRAVERLSLPRTIVMLLSLLAISATISTVRSVDILTALPRLGLYLSVFLLAAAVYLRYRDARCIPVAWYCLAIAIVCLPFLAAVVVEFVEEAGHLFPNGPNVPNFANVRHFGHVCFLAAMSGAALVVLSRRLGILSFALTCCALFGLIATGSRGPLLAWMLFVGLLCCLGPARWRLLACGLASLVAMSALVWYLDSSGLLVTPNIFSRLEETLRQRGGGFDSGRLQLWLDSIHEIAAFPLFGQGPEGYLQSGCCNTWVNHPHNLILQMLMEFGVVGGAILALLCVQTIRLLGGARRLLRLVTSSPGNCVLASMLAAYVALGLIDGMFYFAVPLMHFALFCGLFAAGLRQACLIDRRGAGPS